MGTVWSIIITLSGVVYNSIVQELRRYVIHYSYTPIKYLDFVTVFNTCVKENFYFYKLTLHHVCFSLFMATCKYIIHTFCQLGV